MRYELDRSKFLTQDELTILNQTLDKYPCRDTLILRLAIATGARASELLAITKDRLFDRTRSVLIIANKGSKNREIPLKPALYKALKEWCSEVQGERLFDISYRRLVDIWALYKPCNKPLHSLRHSFAINIYKKTKDIKLVQLALGHRSPTTTAIYTDFEYSIEEMRKLL